MTGPVQVLVVGFERPAFSGEILAELGRLREAGTVRLLDLLLLVRAEDGTFETMPVPEEAAPSGGNLAAEILGGADTGVPERDGAGWSLADAIAPGDTAAVALIEHLWATRLRDVIQRSGGAALEETWLAPDDVARVETLVQGVKR